MGDQILAYNIRRLREDAGLTQEKLGALIGTSAGVIGQWERGERNPKYDNVRRIAKALRVSEDDLYEDSTKRDLVNTKISLEFELEDLGQERAKLFNEFGSAHAPGQMEDIELKISTLDRKMEVLKQTLEELDEAFSMIYGPPSIESDYARNLSDKLSKAFIKLNEKGQQKAVENIEDLTKIAEYRKKDANPE